MSRPVQSKAQNDANAKILRALVKQPDNKTCADCKRNDPRWASWNIGCFLCIRCSGIHRSMGTHISKVKSIDLDIWTPEQMAAIQSWGNKRCNLYWEAHLKAGHVPAEHKVESFIRSKYETRRWAKDGPPPADPSVLDGAASVASVAAAAALPAAASTSSAPSRTRTAPAPAPVIDLLGGDPSPSPATTSMSQGSSSLLDDQPAARRGNGSAAAAKSAVTSPAAAPAKASASTGGGGGLFDLEWHEPPPATTSSISTGSRGKSDILSLFGSSSTVKSPPLAGNSNSGFTSSPPRQSASNGMGAFDGLDSSFSGLNMTSGTSSKPLQPATSSQFGSNAFGAASKPAVTTSGMGAAPPSGSNPWAATAPTPTSTSSGIFNSADVWGGGSSATMKPTSPTTTKTATTGGTGAGGDIWGDFSSSSATSNSVGGGSQAIKDDPFGDIWG